MSSTATHGPRTHVSRANVPGVRRIARLAAFAGALLPLVVGAQASPRPDAPDTLARSIVTGRVTGDDGAPLARVVVLVLETGDSVRTGPAGTFTLVTGWRGPATILARALGRLPAATDVTLPRASDAPPLALVLARAPAAIVPVRVVAAGEYTVGEGTMGTLTPLEVVRTPGTAASVARAVQTLPGVQNVDEGTGLFVRGGDLLETRVLIDDAWIPAPFRGDNPIGAAGPSLDPFLLDRVTFSAGGFGVRQGNAIAGLVTLDAQGRPTRAGGTLGVNSGGARMAGALPIGARAGVRAAIGVSDLGPLVRTFGEAQPFRPAPRGGDASASAEWSYRDGGRVRVVGLTQHGDFGVGAPGALAAPAYRADTRTSLVVASWRDSAGPVRPAVTIAQSRYTRDERAGTFALASDYAVRQLVARLAWQATPSLRLDVGGEHERLVATFDGTAGTGDPIAVRSAGTRIAQYAEVAWHAPFALQVVGGVRTDDATLTGRRTWDPRLSLAWTRGVWAVTAAAGRYSQLPDPALVREAAPAPLRADQVIVGVQRDGERLALRLEGWTRRSDGLPLVTRDRRVLAGGRGEATGLDALVRWRGGDAWGGRLAWSVLHARRTDPDTRVMARAPTDVTHSVTLVGERTFGRLQLSAAFRWATGRPFTDVVATRIDPATGRPDPVWGTPFGARLPAQSRVDLGADWFRPLGRNRGLVLFASLSNLLDRTNVNEVGWSADFTQRVPRRAPFNRSLFVGATLVF